MRHSILGVPRPTAGLLWSHRGLFTALLAIFLCQAASVGPVHADGREDRLLSITKTTVYGALLGGILGFTSALVVRDGYEDDAVRWGIVIGAFGGFAYGIATPEEDDWDDFSLRAHASPADLEVSPPPQLASLQTFPGRSGSEIHRHSKATGTRFRKTAEVHDGGLEEEVCIEEESR